MSRHRNVRNQNYSDDYDGYHDVYGHSYDDAEYGVSPSESQYLYDRSRPTQLSHFVDEDIVEETEPEETDSVTSRLEGARRRLDSLSIESAVAKLGADEEIRLKSCLEYIRNVVGDSFSDNIIKAHILQANYNCEEALDNVLTGVALDPAAVLPEDLWKKAKKDTTPIPQIKVPCIVPDNITEKPTTKPTLQKESLSSLKLTPRGISPFGSPQVQLANNERSPVIFLNNPLFRGITPINKEKEGRAIFDNILPKEVVNGITKNPLFNKPKESTSEEQLRMSSNPLFGKSPIFPMNQNAVVAGCALTKFNTSPLLTTRPILPNATNPLFAVKTILPSPTTNNNIEMEESKPVNSPISSTTSTTPSTPIHRKESSSSGNLSDFVVRKLINQFALDTNNNQTICNEPSVIGLRMARAAATKKKTSIVQDVNEPSFFETWTKLHQKFSKILFKFDTPSPDKLVGAGLLATTPTPLNVEAEKVVQVSSEEAVVPLKLIEDSIEKKQFPKNGRTIKPKSRRRKP